MGIFGAFANLKDFCYECWANASRKGERLSSCSLISWDFSKMFLISNKLSYVEARGFAKKNRRVWMRERGFEGSAICKFVDRVR